MAKFKVNLAGLGWFLFWSNISRLTVSHEARQEEAAVCNYLYVAPHSNLQMLQLSCYRSYRLVIKDLVCSY